ncbi:MAG: exosortase E/protease, VPEID-CTERM system [Deltaproteobacteria bacterium]|nr:exosortase E/protease, VPEID-CTERM system [Deltaproteobacteria bacterium]
MGKQHTEFLRNHALLILGCLAVVAEFLVVSLRYDVEPLRTQGGLWSAIGFAGAAAPATLVAPLLFFIMSDRALRGEASALLRRPPPWRDVLLFGAAHLIAVIAFFTVTGHALPSPDRASATGTPSEGIALLWFFSAGAVMLTTVLTVFEGRPLLSFLRSRWRIVLLAMGLACGAQLAGSASAALWTPLSSATLEGSARVLVMLVPEVVLDPESSVLGTDRFLVEVAPECSGIEGIGLILVFLGVYLWFFRRQLRFPAVLILIPLAVVFIWVANLLRIALLVAVGHWLSPAIAVGGFHSKAGWLFFCVVALSMVGLSRRSGLFARTRPSAPATTPPATAAQFASGQQTSAPANPTATYVVPLLALTGGSMLTGLFAGDIDFGYPVRIVFATLAIAWFWRHLKTDLRGFGSWTSVAVGLFVFALWMVLEPQDVDRAEKSAAFRDALGSLDPMARGAFLGLRILGSTLIVPIVEELAFRGYLQRRLLDRDFVHVPFDRFGWVSFLGSSVAFGLLHQRWVAGILAGMLFSWAQYRRGRLQDAVTAHVVANLLIAGVAVIGGDYALWM